MELAADIRTILEQTKQEIQANMQVLGINASGRTSRGFRVVEDTDSVRLVLSHAETASVPCTPNGIGSVQVGVAPLDTLEIGRPGGAVPKGFYYIIKQWTRDKGMTFSRESDRQTFAYFTARKIAREGTRRNTMPEDVWSTPVNNAKARLRKDVRAAFLAEIHATITNFK